MKLIVIKAYDPILEKNLNRTQVFLNQPYLEFLKKSQLNELEIVKRDAKCNEIV